MKENLNPPAPAAETVDAAPQLVEIAPGLYLNPSARTFVVCGSPLEEKPLVDGKPFTLPQGEQLVEIPAAIAALAAAALAQENQRQPGQAP